MSADGEEIIIVRSMTDSDMGLFSAHQRAAKSRQRAIALTTRAARELLSPDLFDGGGGRDMDCICTFASVTNRELRHIGKVGKNWRLGGRQIAGSEFAALDSMDFALIRSCRHNDGESPILITFVGRRAQRFMQAGLAASIGKQLKESVAIFGSESDAFDALASLFPPVPARIAIQRVQAQPALQLA